MSSNREHREKLISTSDRSSHPVEKFSDCEALHGILILSAGESKLNTGTFEDLHYFMSDEGLNTISVVSANPFIEAFLQTNNTFLLSVVAIVEGSAV